MEFPDKVGYNDWQRVSPVPSKIEAIKQIPVPRCVKGARSFVGLSGYYHRFTKNYTNISAPLTKLTTKESAKKFEWTQECKNAFKKLQNSLCCAMVLIYFKFDREFILITDASANGLGAVVSQLDDNNIERPVAYASKVLSARERKHCTAEKEAICGSIWCSHFSHLLVRSAISDNHGPQRIKMAPQHRP